MAREPSHAGGVKPSREAELQALLVRVEAATGADRELDVLLFAQLAEDRDVRWDGNMLLGRSRRPPHDECVLGTIDPGRVARNFSGGYSKPPYPSLTASLDAALALAKRVLRPGISISATAHDDGTGSCEMWIKAANRFEYAREHNKAGGHDHFHQNVGAATPALAIIVAMLSALIAEAASPESGSTGVWTNQSPTPLSKTEVQS